MQEYIVQPEDTLESIAAKKLGNAGRWGEIARLNQIVNPDLIFVGQKLKLPAPRHSNGSSAKASSNKQKPNNLALAEGYTFILYEQLPDVGDGKIIRKVAVVPRNYALLPKKPGGNLSLAEHAMAYKLEESPYLSASNRPIGSPTGGEKGTPLLIDVNKVVKAGGKVYSVSDVIKDLERYIREHPHTKPRVTKLISVIRDIEGEVLIENGTPPGSGKTLGSAHRAYIKSAERLFADYKSGVLNREELVKSLQNLETQYKQAKIIGRFGRILMIVGVVFTVHDLIEATDKSLTQRSWVPVSQEIARQSAGWGGAMAGMKIGFVTGAAFGIETGPGAILTGMIGAFIFGAIGYHSADYIIQNPPDFQIKMPPGQL